jgi:pimeloyl-ACP methyl ester carboxylesterase
MTTHISNKTAVIHHDVHINYTLSGIGEIALLFVHGSFLDETIWNAQVDYFNSSYQVITIDLAGHGKSGQNRSTWTIEQFGQDVIALLKILQLKQVILIGHSTGADAILEASVLYPQPIIGIIAIEAFKNASTDLPELFSKTAEEMMDTLNHDFANTSEKYARVALLSEETKPAITEQVIKAYREAYPPMGISSTVDALHYMEREQELLQKLPLKLHVINVDYQPTNTETLNNCAAKSYELHTLHGSCHFPMLETPKELNEMLGEVITGITKNRNTDEIPSFVE